MTAYLDDELDGVEALRRFVLSLSLFLLWDISSGSDESATMMGVYLLIQGLGVRRGGGGLRDR